HEFSARRAALRIHAGAVPQYVGNRHAELTDRGQVSGRRIARVAEGVVANDDIAGQRVVVRVLEALAIGADQHVDGAVVADLILEHVDIAIGHNEHAGARRYAGDNIAGRCEVRRVVVVDDVLEHADRVAALLRQARQIEDQDAARIAGGVVVEDVGVVAVLDLDAGDVVLGQVLANDDVARLADINARVRGAARDRALDQHVVAIHRVEAIGPVFGVWTARPLNAHLPDGDAVAVARLDGVATGVLHSEAA